VTSVESGSPLMMAFWRPAPVPRLKK